MKIERAERQRRRKEEEEVNAGFTCLLMQDDWGVLEVCGGGGWGGMTRR